MHENKEVVELLKMKSYNLPKIELQAAPDLPRMKHRGPNANATDSAKRLKKKRADQRKARNRNRKKRK
jgi:hypothetical protein